MAMTSPVVSVLVPAFNCELTIQRALSSLVAQTFGDWEAVFVDDGSTDDTWSRALMVDDDRVRCLRLPENVGRGAARQTALHQSTGQFICTLDADDWYYPWKLERQLAEMEAYPQVVLVSSAMASVNLDGGLAGVWRGHGRDSEVDVAPPLRSLRSMKFPHGTSMIRAPEAQAFEYSTDLRRAEEYHFLARLLKGRRYLQSERVLYAYSDELSFEREGPLTRYLWSAKASLKLLDHFPASASVLAFRKAIQAGVALISGGQRVGSRRRPSPPTRHEIGEFECARERVDAALVELGLDNAL